jgi:pimeloyl-ACP methyl ester carboxylesterase
MSDSRTPPQFHESGRGERLAFTGTAGEAPTVVWLGGYGSDMRGTKAEHLAALATRDGFGFLRLDYSGHGESDGDFRDGTISKWTDDALSVIEARTQGPVILVGSSMGAWIALRIARGWQAQGHSRLAGLLLLAPAPDFTTRLVEPSLTSAECVSLERDGFIARPSEYGPEPTIYTQALLDDGSKAAVMDEPIVVGCPIHIIQGMEDADVPHTHALELVSHLPGDGLTLTLVADGDHRLSRPEDLRRMETALGELIRAARERDQSRTTAE